MATTATTATLSSIQHTNELSVNLCYFISCTLGLCSEGLK